ncbi:probable cytochrome P450 6a13 [Ochlerotatus camptorhynchus]|uniref:probable cytochrome P450 6a13 n=1 Tax=Ochlerotatus camptorhynchus TaxID=644619 RepID=UPI0031DB707B
MIILYLLTVIALAYCWVKRRYSYWKLRGVPCVEPSFPLGNLGQLGRKHVGLINQDVYEQLKASGKKFCGMFFFLRPMALVLDLDFVRNVMVKDFQYFHDRGLYYNDEVEPINSHLVSLEGTRWKNLRAKLTPTFTTGKMKMMFPTITAVADEFVKCLTTAALNGREVEMKDFLARYTTDVIGNCAFGLDCNSLKDPEAEFRVMGRKAVIPTRSQFLRRMFSSSFRALAGMLRVRTIDVDVSEFFMNAVRHTIEYREKHNVQRNDFMNLLMQLKLGPSEQNELTFNEIAAQAFVFFLAGFETSSSTLSYCLYELAHNPGLQDKARRNVEEILAQHDSMTYEAVHEMKYIENCINESLRKYPPFMTIIRQVTENYYVPDMNVTLEKGHGLIISVHAIHNDPRYYPDPDKFDPERFSPEEVAKRHPMAFIPFGEGPRICIGLRFGMMQACIGLAYLLKHFRFSLSPKMELPLKTVPTTIVSNSEGGLWLNVEPL